LRTILDPPLRLLLPAQVVPPAAEASGDGVHCGVQSPLQVRTRRTGKDARMNLDDAIKAHADWKLKLRTAIAKKETVDAASLGRDNCCPLGKWLHGEGQSLHGRLQSFKDCKARHAEFHAAAGRIAQDINAQRYAEAEKQLGNGTPYATASGATAAAIIRLKKEVTQPA
jgi:hypothetical protein